MVTNAEHALHMLLCQPIISAYSLQDLWVCRTYHACKRGCQPELLCRVISVR
jgi:hypothetical protein